MPILRIFNSTEKIWFLYAIKQTDTCQLKKIVFLSRYIFKNSIAYEHPGSVEKILESGPECFDRFERVPGHRFSEGLARKSPFVMLQKSKL